MQAIRLRGAARTFVAVVGLVILSAAATAATLKELADADRAWNAPTLDLDSVGYVVEEFYIDGVARAFEAVGERGRDGRWKTRRTDETAPYRSRMLVVRPRDSADFNGTVIVHWQNVTAGFDLGSVTGGEILEGYAWVGVTAQKIGVDGMGEAPNGLRQSNPRRYGSLNHPGDAYSFDIFTQAGRAVLEGGDEPLGGFKVERLIAAGASQSAHRLRTYINGVHHHEKVFDGFIPYIDFGAITAFDSAPRGPGGGLREQASIRSDLDVPVIVVNSETETGSYYAVREQESQRFRFWEVAGTAHVAAPEGQPIPGLESPNWLSFGPVYDSAIRHLDRWLRDGQAPPTLPRIEIAAQTSPFAEVARDALGNAVGGIRLPELEVPTAVHSGIGTMGGGNRFSFLYGKAQTLPVEQLRQMYPTRASYLEPFEEALDRVIASGAVLEAAKWDAMRAAEERFDRLLGE